MKKTICLYFQVHQPSRLRLYRFFDIGKDSHYYDDFANRTIMRRLAQRCYLPMNTMLLELIERYKGSFRLAFSISGSALEHFDRYAPEVVESFRKLAQTGCVEFLAETYYHSLSSLASKTEFAYQVERHKSAIEEHFGVTPVTFRNTELIYSDNIGKQVYDLGFKAMVTEGARHILGRRSPDFVYSCDIESHLKLLLRNNKLSDDIALNFSNADWCEYPLTADKYVSWLKGVEGDIVNLFMDYETFGDHQSAESGIFDFMRALPQEALSSGELEFQTPSAAAKKYKAVDEISVPDAISWAGDERDVTSWLGNELQQDAYNKLYSITEKLAILNDPMLWSDFGHLQESDHLFYMGTQHFGKGSNLSSPYDSPYEAFINYMNVLSDFMIRVDNAIAEKQ